MNKKRPTFSNGRFSLQKIHPVKGKRFAFTLAEVLITLGIIGVVAALTLPSLINKHRSYVLHKQFNVAHSLIEQNMRRLYFEQKNIFDDLQNCGGAGFATPFIAKISEEYIKLFDNPKPLDSNYIKANYRIASINKPSSDEAYVFSRMHELSNGMTIGFSGSALSFIVAFDTNGYRKGPNRGGFDIFKFEYNAKDGKLAIRHDGEGASCKADPKQISLRFWDGCSAHAITNKGIYKGVVVNDKGQLVGKYGRNYWDYLPW